MSVDHLPQKFQYDQPEIYSSRTFINLEWLYFVYKY